MGTELEGKFLATRKSENPDICYHPWFVYVELRALTPPIFLSSFESRDLQVGKKMLSQSLSSHSSPSFFPVASGRKRPLWANSNMSLLVFNPADFLGVLFEHLAKHMKGRAWRMVLLVEWLLHSVPRLKMLWGQPATAGTVGIFTNVFHKEDFVLCITF